MKFEQVVDLINKYLGFETFKNSRHIGTCYSINTTDMERYKVRETLQKMFKDHKKELQNWEFKIEEHLHVFTVFVLVERMSEKKYYVKLVSPREHSPIFWCGNNSEWQPYHLEPVYGGEVDEWGEGEIVDWKVPDTVPAFTKAELASFMGGRMYQKSVNMDSWNPKSLPVGYIYNEIDKTYEYINPFIELIPKKEEE